MYYQESDVNSVLFVIIMCFVESSISFCLLTGFEQAGVSMQAKYHVFSRQEHLLDI